MLEKSVVVTQRTMLACSRVVIIRSLSPAAMSMRTMSNRRERSSITLRMLSGVTDRQRRL